MLNQSLSPLSLSYRDLNVVREHECVNGSMESIIVLIKNNFMYCTLSSQPGTPLTDYRLQTDLLFENGMPIMPPPTKETHECRVVKHQATQIEVCVRVKVSSPTTSSFLSFSISLVVSFCWSNPPCHVAFVCDLIQGFEQPNPKETLPREAYSHQQENFVSLLRRSH